MFSFFFADSIRPANPIRVHWLHRAKGSCHSWLLSPLSPAKPSDVSFFIAVQFFLCGFHPLCESHSCHWLRRAKGSCHSWLLSPLSPAKPSDVSFFIAVQFFLCGFHPPRESHLCHSWLLSPLSPAKPIRVSTSQFFRTALSFGPYCYL